MLTKEKFQKILLGNVGTSSGIQRARILFSASTIVAITLSSLIFMAYDVYLGYPTSLLVYTSFILIFGYALHLLRSEKYHAGLTLLLVALNFFIYLVMSSIPEDSMSAIFYIGLLVVEYVLLGHEKKLRLFALLGLSFSLYLVDTYVNFSLLPTRQYDEATLQVNKVVDFVICSGVILITVKLLIDYLQAIISERTRTNEELQRLNKELDKYAYTITHDIKGPVQSLKSLIYLLENDQSNVDQYLKMMKQSFENLSALIDDVTERTRNRDFEIKHEKFNLRKTIEVIWDMSRHSSDAEGIAFTIDMPEELIVNTDKTRIIGVLNNLITNSIRYHDKSKDHPYIKVSGSLTDQMLHVSVEDNGSGIEAKHQEKVFEMFYRASKKQGGSGLGLFSVKEVIEKLSGQIALESTYGEGTIFSIKIPLLLTGKKTTS